MNHEKAMRSGTPGFGTRNTRKKNENLLSHGGTTWYPDSQAGGPAAHSSFLYWHINRYNAEAAYLMTHRSGIDALDWQLQHLKNGGGPLMPLFQWDDGTHHAIVEYAIRYDNRNKTVNLVYYNDPYIGKQQEKLRDDWILTTYLSGGY